MCHDAGRFARCLIATATYWALMAVAMAAASTTVFSAPSDPKSQAEAEARAAAARPWLAQVQRPTTNLAAVGEILSEKLSAQIQSSKHTLTLCQAMVGVSGKTLFVNCESSAGKEEFSHAAEWALMNTTWRPGTIAGVQREMVTSCVFNFVGNNPSPDPHPLDAVKQMFKFGNNPSPDSHGLDAAEQKFDEFDKAAWSATFFGRRPAYEAIKAGDDGAERDYFANVSQADRVKWAFGDIAQTPQQAPTQFHSQNDFYDAVNDAMLGAVKASHPPSFVPPPREQFEKTPDYEARVQTARDVFEKGLAQYAGSQEQRTSEARGAAFSGMAGAPTISDAQYDADREVYVVTVKSDLAPLSVTAEIPLPMSQAKTLLEPAGSKPTARVLLDMTDRGLEPRVVQLIFSPGPKLAGPVKSSNFTAFAFGEDARTQWMARQEAQAKAQEDANARAARARAAETAQVQATLHGTHNQSQLQVSNGDYVSRYAASIRRKFMSGGVCDLLSSTIDNFAHSNWPDNIKISQIDKVADKGWQAGCMRQ